MRVLLNFVCLNLPHQWAERYLCFVLRYDWFCSSAGWHPWRTLDPLSCLGIHHCIFLKIQRIFLVGPQYHQSCNICRACKSHRTKFTSIFDAPNQFGNYFADNLPTFGRTKFDLSHQLDGHRKYVELHGPTSWPVSPCFGDCRNLFRGCLGRPCSSLSSWMYSEIWLELGEVKFESCHTCQAMTSQLMGQISTVLSIQLRTLSIWKWKWRPWTDMIDQVPKAC